MNAPQCPNRRKRSIRLTTRLELTTRTEAPRRNALDFVSRVSLAERLSASNQRRKRKVRRQKRTSWPQRKVIQIPVEALHALLLVEILPLRCAHVSC